MSCNILLSCWNKYSGYGEAFASVSVNVMAGYLCRSFGSFLRKLSMPIDAPQITCT